MLQKTVGKRIRMFRTIKGYKISELARLAHINPGQLSKMEQGSVSFTMDSLEKVLSAIDVSYSVFFQFHDVIPIEDDPIIAKTASRMKSMTSEEQLYLCETAKLLYEKRDHNE